MGRGLPKRVDPETVGHRDRRLELATPRDRNGTFEPRLVPKGERRVGGLSDMIISLYSGGITIRDIQAHLERTLGTQLSHETIANITDAGRRRGHGRQARPLEPAYPIVYLDALVVKVSDYHAAPQQGRTSRRRGRRRRGQARAGDLGADQRTDFPARDDEQFLTHLLNHRNADGTSRVERLPVTITRWPPGERVYGR